MPKNPNLANHWIASVETKQGNSLNVSFDRETNLLVIDLVAANQSGGNEIVRMKIEPGVAQGHFAGKTQQLQARKD